MDDNIILTTIRRSNQKWLLLSLGGFLILIVAGIISVDYLYNFFRGPFSLTREDVLAISSLESQREFFVTVNGDDVVDTGFEYVSIDSDGGETVESSYPMLFFDDRLLIVQSPGRLGAELGTQFTGELVEIPAEVSQEVIAEIEREVPELQGAFMPFMLDADNFREPGFIGLGIGALIFAASAWGLYTAITRTRDPSRHPIMRGLQWFGEPQSVAQRIDYEIRHNSDQQKIGNVHLTRAWLAHKTRSNLSATRIEDIAWIYKKVTQRKLYYIIPIQKTYAAIVKDRHGETITVPGRQQQVDELLSQIARHVPWAKIGYDKSFETAWNSDRAAVLAAVDQRRAELSGE